MKGKVGLLFLVLMGYAATMLAAPVSENAARRKAVAFMTNKAQQRRAIRGSSQARRAVSSSDLALAESRQAYYVFNLSSDEGYVIVSGDDRLPEVIGYSLSGTYDSRKMPDNKRAWMEEYVRQYEYLQRHPEAAVTSQDATQREAVAPLLTCHFSQHTPYNDQCPTIDGTKAPTGCVATAMAQIMYYYQWPKQTTKTIPAYTTDIRKISMPSIPVTTIDWDHMLGEYNYGSYDSLQAEAISTLMLLCGAAVEMDYDLDGSGAGAGAYDFQEYFGYADQAEDISRYHFSSEQWELILYEELAAERPVLYGGFSETQGGHEFVIDGYNDGYFHVNFGWGGASDDYFKMPNLGRYVRSHSATIGLQPDNGKNASLYSVLDNGTLTLFYDKEKKNRQGTALHKRDWQDHAEEITELIIDPSLANYKPRGLIEFFGGLKNLKSIKGLANLNTKNLTNIIGMFYNCSSLTSLDLSGFNTQNVVYMDALFRNCSSLTSLDLSGFNTQNVKGMRFMFGGCSSLTSLDLSNFNTQNVTEMDYMFDNCSSLTSLDLSRFNAQNVTGMENMFYNCSSLTSLDLSGFNAQNVTDMFCMFGSCRSLTSLNLSGFNAQNVTYMTSMFYGCSSLTSLDLSGFNAQNVTNMERMFLGCSSLTSLDVSGFNTQNVRNMTSIFAGCSSLTSLDLSGFNTQNVENMEYMFSGCSSLTSLDMSGFNTQNVMSMIYMFHDCSSLTSLDLSGFNTQNVTNMDFMFYNCSGLTTIYADEKSWSTKKVQSGDDVFSYCNKLVGGNGTVYSANHVDSEYARVDKEGAPGYFTQKEGTAIQLPTAKGQKVDVWYTLDGRKLMGKPMKRGVYFSNGQKVVIK